MKSPTKEKPTVPVHREFLKMPTEELMKGCYRKPKELPKSKCGNVLDVVLRPFTDNINDRSLYVPADLFEDIKSVAKLNHFAFGLDHMLSSGNARQFAKALSEGKYTLNDNRGRQAIQAIVELCNQGRGLKLAHEDSRVSRVSIGNDKMARRQSL